MLGTAGCLGTISWLFSRSCGSLRSDMVSRFKLAWGYGTHYVINFCPNRPDSYTEPVSTARGAGLAATAAVFRLIFFPLPSGFLNDTLFPGLHLPVPEDHPPWR